METAILLMYVDTVALLVITVCCAIIVVEHKALTIWWRVVAAGIGYHAFAQTSWLNGHWVPSAIGYPWPRLGFDLLIAVAAVAYTVTVFQLKPKPKHVRVGRGTPLA